MRTLGAWLISAFFGAWETAHYGWNMTPHSNGELICDGITMALVMMALIVSCLEHPTR